jgi:multicomponent Na+:H+ antiporter subunit F
MISTLFTTVLYISLAVHAALISYAIYRVWRGENVGDRLLGTELVGTLVISVLVLVAIVEDQNLFIDVALSLAALGFIGVVAFAKYATDERIF